VGVYDPATGKLEIIEARRMEVRGTVRQFQVPEKGAQPTVRLDPHMVIVIVLTVPLQTAGDPRSGVGLAFGTKKSQKALASTTENAIGPSKSERLRADGKSQKFDATTAAVMASMADTTADMATKDELQEQADSSKPRPTANLEATEVRDVYTIDSLIGVEMMKHIPVMDWEQSIKAKKEIIVNSRYVAHRIQSAGSNIEKLKILRYMLLLIDFLNIAKPARGGARALPKRDSMKTAMGGIPEVLVEGVKRKFADGGFIPKFKSDLLITHLCAMACLVDNYEVDMFDLQEDLRLETKDMAQYFREIGAKVGALSEAQRKVLKLEKAAAAQRRVAKLKLPLDFPKVAFGRRAR
jgi:DNA-directed RNA polymerase I subunit RPA49